MTIRLLTAFLALTCASTVADEGMWTLENFPAQRVKNTYGSTIDTPWLNRIRSSVARLDGGCSGSFASKEGLVLTNNHCIWGCIRNLSSAEKNLSEEGFLAASRAEERSCPGMRISVLIETEDITANVVAATQGKPESEANEARKAKLSALEKSCEKQSGLGCESVNLYRGGQYFLYKYRRFDDVRLAFAPELPIAAFGGDPDNFNFPRWSLDMSLLRVYEDGKPATTTHFLPWRKAGPNADELVFVAGHPGTTRRLMTVDQLEHRRSSLLPQQLLQLSELRGRLLAWAKTGEEPARIVQQRILNYENAIKVYRQQLRALSDERQMAAKRSSEQALRDAVASDPKLAGAYGSAWKDVAVATQRYTEIEDRYRFIEAAQGFRGSLFSFARTLVRGTVEREKPNEQRLRAYRDTAIPRVEQQLFADAPVYPEYEQLQLGFSLAKLREWLGPDDVTVKRVLGTSSPDDLAMALVSGSRLADPEVRKQLWQGGVDAINQSDDPMIALARDIESEARELDQTFRDDIEAIWNDAAEKIAKARFEIGGTDVYPDATFTLRVTYGSVTGWKEKGATVDPFTYSDRLFERTTGSDPFRLPQSWENASTVLAPDLPFNLVATTDIIGGNSGSPMIDTQGRLVGLVFDGNIHSIAGAFWFNPHNNRTVAVHPAVMLESLEKIYGASDLLDELTVVN